MKYSHIITHQLTEQIRLPILRQIVWPIEQKRQDCVNFTISDKIEFKILDEIDRILYFDKKAINYE